MSFSGTEVTEKGLARGWDPDTQDQDAQRIFRTTSILEAALFRPFAWKVHDSVRLQYHYYGGYVDDGGAWTFVPDGFITLDDNATLYIEHDLLGVVSSNQVGFTYPGRIPMATIETSNGEIVRRTYVDSRPEVIGQPSGGGGGKTFFDISGFLLPSQIQPNTCYLAAGGVSGGTGGEFGEYCGPPADYWFPAQLGVGGPPILDPVTPLQVYGDIDLQGAIRFYNGANAAENVIFAAGTGDEFARITNFISDSTLWGVRSRTGLVNSDDREATLGLVRTDNAGNEEISDYYNNGFFSSPDTIAVGHGLRIIRTGLDSDPLRGHWRPYRMDWYHGDTMLEVPGYTIWSPEDPGGPCFQFHIPVKLPFSNQMANDLFLETDLGSFVLQRATSRKPWTPHDRCASNDGFS